MCSPSDGGGFLIVALLCEKRKGIPGILISPAVVCLVVVTSSLAIVCVAVSACSTAVSYTHLTLPTIYSV